MTGGIFRVGNRVFAGGTHIMGILNVTPDSFYAGSRVSADEIARRALEMVRAGAEVLDIGGESTRPGAAETDAEEEAARVLPAVAAVRAVTDCPVSVDTRRAEIARLALMAGADMINDVSGAEGAAIYEEVARAGASVCIMHNGRAGIRGDIIAAKREWLSRAVELAALAGMPRERILLDGGIGFNGGAAADRELEARYAELGSLGLPLLIGASRKSFLGGAPEDRLPATLAVTERAARAGVLFVRVHDIAENLAAIRRAEEKK